MLLHAATVFLSAFLLFLVQPLLAKQILPWFGGAAIVWTLCMVFFQLVLLLGYAYAHWLTSRVAEPRQDLLGEERLHQEEQKSAQEDGCGVQQHREGARGDREREVRRLYLGMLARYLRIMLLAEATAYAAVAHWLNSRFGWSYAALAGMALAFALAIRLAIVCAAEALAYAVASPRPPEHRIGPGAAVAMVLREWRAATAVNLYRFPFEYESLREDPQPHPATRIPVVLVHGYLSNRGYFGPLARALEARGVQPLFAPDFSAMLATIERFAGELHGEIERIAAGTGQPKIVLVCHSMGGLAARAYLAAHGAARVAKLVTIASPHHGTVHARLGAGSNARQMQPGSAFLESLRAHESERVPAVPATSICLPHDNLVSPQDSSRLDWAKNVALPGFGHIEVLHSPRLADLLVQELREAGVEASG
jgi:pimeloyl-ACP methyl ester carboxylesterase